MKIYNTLSTFAVVCTGVRTTTLLLLQRAGTSTAYVGHPATRPFQTSTSTLYTFSPSSYPRSRRRPYNYDRQKSKQEYVDEMYRNLRNEVSSGNCNTAGNCNAGWQQQQQSGVPSMQSLLKFFFEQLDDNAASAGSAAGPAGIGTDPSVVQRQKMMQKAWINKALDFFSGLNRDLTMSPEEYERNEEELRQIRDAINRMYTSATSTSKTDPTSTSTTGTNRMYSPRYEEVESDDAYEIIVEVPGVKKTDIQISLEEPKATAAAQAAPGPSYLVIEGIRRRPRRSRRLDDAVVTAAADVVADPKKEEVRVVGDAANNDGSNSNQVEEDSGPSEDSQSFCERFVLKDDADTETISASVENGILAVRLLKLQPPQQDEENDDTETAQRRMIPIQ